MFPPMETDLLRLLEVRLRDPRTQAMVDDL
jgi:hypothetical protein